MKMKSLKAILLMIVALSVSCGPAIKNPTPLGMPGTQAVYPEPEYIIRIGDQLSVKFFYNPELNEEVLVRPDGHISLQLIGEMKVIGMTPSELTQTLRQRYAAELTNPDVTVIMRTFGAHKVYIAGEVENPGIMDLIGPVTLFQGITSAGGFKVTARTNEVVVIRRQWEAGPGTRPIVMTADLDKLLDGTDLSQDILLQAFDMVYVPRSPIANVNLWVEQYIRQTLLVLPREFLLYYAIFK